MPNLVPMHLQQSLIRGNLGQKEWLLHSIVPLSIYWHFCSTGRPCHAALLFKCLEVGDSPLHILKDLQKLGDWMTKVDLRDAYFMVPIHKDKAFLRS